MESRFLQQNCTHASSSSETCILNSSVRGRVSSSRRRFSHIGLSEIRPGGEVQEALQKSTHQTWQTGCVQKLDTADLTIGGVQNLFVKLETRPRTEQFKPLSRHKIDTFFSLPCLLLSWISPKRMPVI